MLQNGLAIRKTCMLLFQDWVSVPISHMEAYNSSRDLAYSFGLLRKQACTLCTCIYAGKTLMHNTLN